MAAAQRAAQAAGIIVILTIVSKVLGFLREASLASVFGAGTATDAYLVATIVPSMVFGIVGTAITTVGIPVFTEYRQDGKKGELPQLVWSSFHGLILILLSLTALGLLLAPWITRLLAPGFDSQRLGLATGLSRILLVMVVFMGLSGWAGALLNSHQRFAANAAIGLPYNLIMISAIILAGRHWGIAGVAWATVLATASQFLIQVPSIWQLRLPYRPAANFRHPGVIKMLSLAGPVLIGVGASQLNTIVDRMLASGLMVGSISALNYALRLMGLPQGLLGTPIVTVLYPRLAEKGTAGDYEGFRDLLARGLGILAFLMIPLAAGLVVLRQDIVSLAFQRGAFDATDTAMTAFALLFYSLGLPFILFRDYLARACYALQDAVTPMWTGLLTVGMNIVFNLILVRYLAHGGLALATSLANLCGAAAVLIILRARLGGIGGAKLAGSLARILVAAAIMSGVVWGLDAGGLHGTGWPLLAPLLTSAPGAGGVAVFATVLIRLLLLVLVGGVVYSIAAYFLRSPEMDYCLELLWQALDRIIPPKTQERLPQGLKMWVRTAVLREKRC